MVDGEARPTAPLANLGYLQNLVACGKIEVGFMGYSAFVAELLLYTRRFILQHNVYTL